MRILIAIVAADVAAHSQRPQFDGTHGDIENGSNNLTLKLDMTDLHVGDFDVTDLYMREKLVDFARDC